MLWQDASEIERTKQSFARAARKKSEAGFSGIKRHHVNPAIILILIQIIFIYSIAEKCFGKISEISRMENSFARTAVLGVIR
jgi:hypothetical protein